MRFIAMIHKDPDSAFGVQFPDVPGCFSAGETLEEASQNAVEALGSHIRMLEADGDAIPQPRSLDAIVDDESLNEARADAILVSVPLVRDLGSTTRINVSLDLGLLQAIDDEARSRGQTRSAFIASAVRRELAD
ncbi:MULTISPECIES: type II toxin-antitoxin system HicB family antitoxin [Devosia]|mgnify:CR=1 FL=1|uniref:Ribbon-helix-helix protein, copG family n=1 Tax=Devosia equisanguinis TaxID=2490941 RepID=A0A3S4EMB9_9HYPH|nr:MULTISPECIES: type II toxin-antitoxin system HicB family antitoxin [Devosia]VDS05301.1 Ribbon-helix-helix protein, copG family [Devosia equisanguinis]